MNKHVLHQLWINNGDFCWSRKIHFDFERKEDKKKTKSAGLYQWTMRTSKWKQWNGCFFFPFVFVICVSAGACLCSRWRVHILQQSNKWESWRELRLWRLLLIMFANVEIMEMAFAWRQTPNPYLIIFFRKNKQIICLLCANYICHNDYFNVAHAFRHTHTHGASIIIYFLFFFKY